MSRLLLAAFLSLACLAAGAEEVLRSDLLRQAQRSLAKHGHAAGVPDGVMGTKTEQALREFQQSRGLAVTGALNHQTLDALGLTRNLAAGASAAVGGSGKAGRK